LLEAATALFRPDLFGDGRLYWRPAMWAANNAGTNKLTSRPFRQRRFG
jgi:hypothetical protein